MLSQFVILGGKALGGTLISLTGSQGGAFSYGSMAVKEAQGPGGIDRYAKCQSSCILPRSWDPSPSSGGGDASSSMNVRREPYDIQSSSPSCISRIAR